MGRRRVFVSLVIVLSMLGLPGSAVGDAPSDVGEWSAPFSENGDFDAAPPATLEESLRYPPAVSTVVLPDGRILYWGGLEGLEDSAGPLAFDAGRSAKLSRARVLDIRSGVDDATWTTPTPETGGSDDMFCADQRVLHDGTVLIAGGTIYASDPVDLSPVTGEDGPGGTAELFGSNATRIFDPTTDAFTTGDDMSMANGRWYPTLVTLPDGRVFVASGVERLLYNTTGFNVHETEIFDPAQRRWVNNGEDGATTLPLFARLHLLPSGDVFYTGVGQMWSPFGQAADEAMWNLHKAYDPGENAWAVTGIGALGARSGALSVMLPLRPNEDGSYGERAQILVAGGAIGTSPGSYVSNTLTEVITVGPGDDGSLESSSELVADLNNSRWYSSGVALPDGSVVAVSGGDKDEVIAPGTEAPVRQAELWDGERWLPLASAQRDRTYHNSAVLLADGSVLVGGHSPINSLYGADGNGTGDTTFYGNDTTDGTLANNLKDPSFEVLRPPYLFRGERPRIAHVQAGVSYDEAFEIDADGPVDQVVLVRLPSTTHVTDADMRVVELPFTSAGNQVTAIAPPDGNIAPPGYYYLFALRDNGEGVTPSKARIVKVGESLAAQAPAPMGI